jgi:hypothetical protein
MHQPFSLWITVLFILAVAIAGFGIGHALQIILRG